MALLQLDIPDDLNKKLKLYYVKNDFSNRESGVLNILEERLNE